MFQGVRRVWQGENEALFEVAWPEGLADGGEYHAHPAAADAYLNGILAAVGERRTWLPVGLDETTVYGSLPKRGWTYARFREQTATRLLLDWWILGEDGRTILASRGMRYRALAAARPKNRIAESLYQAGWESRALPAARPAGGRWLLCVDRQGTGLALAARLRAQGARCVTVEIAGPGEHPSQPTPDRHRVERWEELESLAARLGPWEEAVHLWSLDRSPEGVEEQEHAFLSAAGLARALARQRPSPRLWLITRQVHNPRGRAESLAPGSASLWGLGRVLANEQPGLRPRLVDLGDASATELEVLSQALLAGEEEREMAIRGSERYVSRLRPLPLTRPGGEIPFRLVARQPGSLESLVFESATPQEPKHGEIRIEIRAAGLNFKDIVKTLNLIDAEGLSKTYSGPSLGFECAGVVLGVGEGVSDFRPGDEVVALAPHCFGNEATTLASLAAPKPADLDFAAAATLPVAYLTAFVALVHFGRLQPGERVLIHAAAGGVGQAAIQIARRLGAEVLATAGSPEKRAHLAGQGIACVMDSRSLAFAEETMQATSGQGVDLVLNTLPPRTLPASLSTLRRRGRFIDLSNIYQEAQLDLRAFQKGLSATAFDLDQLMKSDPAWVAELFREAMAFVRDRGCPPLPHRAFSIAEAPEAFRLMAQAQHLGKVVLTLTHIERVTIDVSDAPSARLRPDATYVVTGGTSGFGLATARWLAGQGARHLALVSRQGAHTDEARAAAAEWAAQGMDIVLPRADVADQDELAAALGAIARTQPPIRGVVHAAAVYEDATLENVTPDGFARVYLPKARGAWNLHLLTGKLDLDFFVLFSSVAATVGNPGQASYGRRQRRAGCAGGAPPFAGTSSAERRLGAGLAARDS